MDEMGRTRGKSEGWACWGAAALASSAECGLSGYGWAAVVEASEVVGRSGQGPFDADGFEPAPPKAAHAALLFEDPEDRFD